MTLGERMKQKSTALMTGLLDMFAAASASAQMETKETRTDKLEFEKGYPSQGKRIWKNSATRRDKSLLYQRSLVLARLEKPHIGDSLTRRE